MLSRKIKKNIHFFPLHIIFSGEGRQTHHPSSRGNARRRSSSTSFDLVLPHGTNTGSTGGLPRPKTSRNLVGGSHLLGVHGDRPCGRLCGRPFGRHDDCSGSWSPVSFCGVLRRDLRGGT